MRFDTRSDMGFASSFFAIRTLGRESEMADGTFVFFAELRGWRDRCGDIEHGAVAGTRGDVACGRVIAVVGAVRVRARSRD